MTDKPDMVDHPPHYKSGGMEAIDIIEAFNLDFRLGSVIKYVLRADRKGTRELDLKKAKWYLDRVISGADTDSEEPPAPNFNPSLIQSEHLGRSGDRQTFKVSAETGDIMITWEGFLRDARMLAQKLSVPSKVFVAVVRDGLFPAGVIAHYRASLPCIPMRTFNINRFEDRREKHMEYEPEWHGIPYEGRGTLFIDAIADTGKTSEALKNLFPMAEIACVYVKPQGKAAVDYWAVELPQEPWVVFPWDENGKS